MNKAVLAFAAAATIALTSVAATNPAEAQRRGRGNWVAPAIIGGAILGAGIAAGAYAYPRTYYPAPGYEPYPAYGVAPAYGCPGGYWARRPVRDQWGNVVGWSRPRFFCPY